jgi:glycosyltransferase involved in cell wall biosynthesis
MQLKKQKIGIDIRDLKIAKTGAHTYLSELCKAIKNSEQNLQFEYVFLDTRLPIYTGSHKIGKLWEQINYVFWKQVTLPIKAWLNGCKLVFCTDYFVPNMHLGFTTVPVFHDAFFWEYPAHYNKYWLWFFNTVGTSAAKKSSAVVTVTSYAKDQIAKYSGIDATKIIPIHIGPKSSIAASSSSALDAVKLGSVQTTSTTNNWEPLLSKKYILHVGTIEKRKNLTTLLAAFELLLQNNPQDLYLIVVGQKSNKPTLKDDVVFEMVAASSLLKEHVIFTGYLTDHQTATLYKHAALYIFPSVNEGFGIPILEAFAHKVPVLAANNSCLPEVAGNAAIGFDPYNADALSTLITQTLQDEALLQSLQQKGLERLTHFTWVKTLDALEAVFERSINNAKAQ